jgi:8-oxo-dGTP pyrophosphatase MutT (NUDIX family)
MGRIVEWTEVAQPPFNPVERLGQRVTVNAANGTVGPLTRPFAGRLWQLPGGRVQPGDDLGV